MRNKQDLKTVRRTVLMTERTAASIDEEALKRGIKPNAVMNERLQHSNHDNTPEKMADFQNFANEAIRMLARYSSTDAKQLEKEAHKRWTF